MPNNFRIISGIDVFTSKDGSDANPVAADPNLPKLTLADQGVVNNTVGTGEYKGAFSLNPNITTRKYLADHFCKILCTADFIFPSGNGTTQTYFNEGSLGGWWWIDFNSFALNLNRGHTRFKRAILDNIQIVSNTQHDLYFNDCALINPLGVGNCNIDFRITNSKLFNASIAITAYSNVNSLMIDTYVDEASVISIPSYFSTPATQFNNNNFRGILIVGGVQYELKQDKDGNAIDPRPAVNDIITIDAGIYTRGNFSQDPLFLNLGKKDVWSVDAASPNLFSDSSGLASIGDVSAGSVITVLDSELSTGATIINLIISAGDLVIQTPPSDGSVESANIQAFVIAQQIGRVMFAVLLNFNSLQPAGGAENTNVLAVQNYAVGTAGANPRRLTYELMWTDAETAPTTDAEYTNNGYFTAGTMAVFQAFDIPKIDVSGNGNGLPNFVVSGSAPILGKHFKAKITLLHNIG